MGFVWEGVLEAGRLLAGGDREVLHAIWVTLYCTGTALALAALVAIPYGAWLGLYRPRGRRIQVLLLRVGMFIPTVVVGLTIYGLLSRQGPLGWIDSLYTKQAIVLGEFLLAFPILGTLSHAAVADRRGTPLETALTLGAGRGRAMLTLLAEARTSVIAACLAAFARCFSELGVAITVGGNLQLRTRTLASTVVLDLSKGQFGKALAPGLILVALACLLASSAWFLDREREASE
jgi:tungstate transport system permease protein